MGSFGLISVEIGETEIELPLLVAEEQDGLAVNVEGCQPRPTG